MHEALTGLLERAELAIAASRGVVAEFHLDPLSDLVDEARARLQYPEDVTIVVLAGGTGSGKSSLFNALTEFDHAEVGATRPVTSTPLAGVPRSHADAIARFLDELEVTRRVEQGALPGICLIDLPDTDSVETDHRHTVEAIMPRVDVMVWVVDPEKYRDAALHHRYLAQLAPYRNQLVVALNQVDRLSLSSLERVMADLTEALVEDGIGGVPVVATAARPAAGPPLGVDSLARALIDMSSDRPPLYGKLITDLIGLSLALEARIGPPTAYRERSAEAAANAAATMASGDVDGAVSGLVGFVVSLGEEVGGLLSEEILAFAADLPQALHERAQVIAPGEGKRRWWRRPTASLPEPEGPALEAIQEVLSPLREMMTRRAVAFASVADLAVAAQAMAARSHPVT